jgi:hypothetical protein
VRVRSERDWHGGEALNVSRSDSPLADAQARLQRMEPPLQPSVILFRPDMMVQRPQPALPVSPHYADEAIVYTTAPPAQPHAALTSSWLYDSPYVSVHDVDINNVYTTAVQHASTPPRCHVPCLFQSPCHSHLRLHTRNRVQDICFRAGMTVAKGTVVQCRWNVACLVRRECNCCHAFESQLTQAATCLAQVGEQSDNLT